MSIQQSPALFLSTAYGPMVHAMGRLSRDDFPKAAAEKIRRRTKED
ncbi:hypothetical protein [Granulicella sp. dw_53]|nr:hypothetical protein [Granulicella sp. dw_53]